MVEVCEKLDYSKLEKEYVRVWRKVNPATLFMVLVYAYMRRLYSSQQIEEACRTDIRFMWILGMESAPDHSTIARFQNERLAPVIEDLFYSSAFEGCTALTDVTIGNGAMVIDQKAFYGCTSLRDLTIGSSVVYIGQAAVNTSSGTSALTEVTFVRPAAEGTLQIVSGAFPAGVTLRYSGGGRYALFDGDHGFADGAALKD